MNPNDNTNNRNDDAGAQGVDNVPGTPQAGIPLQDLSRSTGRGHSVTGGESAAPNELNVPSLALQPDQHHVSWHSQALLPSPSQSHGARSFLNHSMGRGTQYTRLSETSPGYLGYNEQRPEERDSFDTVRLSVDLGNGGHADDQYNQNAGRRGAPNTAPVGATVGLSIQPSSDSQQNNPYRDVNDSSEDLTSYPGILTSPSRDEFTGPSQVSLIESSEDTVPLTRPQEGRPGRARHASNHLRPGIAGSRLGDDLRLVEEGRHQNAADEYRSRSLSPSNINQLGSRAQSMMRMMSQRVVNLGNEPEMLEQSLRNRSRSRGAESRDTSPVRRENGRRGRHQSTVSFDDITLRMSNDAPKVASTPEKSPSPSPLEPSSSMLSRQRAPNPLKGKTFGIFGPENCVRKGLCEVLICPFTEPIIFLLILLQTILLAVEASLDFRNAHYVWGAPALDIAFFVLFVIYTIEIIAKSIVSGFIFNAREYSTLDQDKSWVVAMREHIEDLFMPHRPNAVKKQTSDPFLDHPQASILRSFTGHFPEKASTDPLQPQRLRLARRAFLRHSFNRLDFIAVVSYWIALALGMTHLESSRHIFVFRMMSCLRILRLLCMTTGTSVILLGLKKAAPLLLNVAFLMGFFWLMFAIIGVQSFKASFSRTCIWIDPEGKENYTIDNGDVSQFCGGYLDAVTGEKMPWIRPPTGDYDPVDIKGFLCPRGSLCIQGTDNPYNGTLSFDDIFHSLEAVFVIMSSNTFTDLLYYTTQSDYLAASLFFITGYIILALWLVNLLVAVITSSFQLIREETKRSAFATESLDGERRRHEDATAASTEKPRGLMKIYSRTVYFWILIIAFDLVVQCLRTADMGQRRERLINDTELIVTCLLAVDIVLRFLADIRGFHRRWRNWIDLFLAVITCIMQAPNIKNSHVYMGLTIFQILRAYRIVLAFAVTRDLTATVFKNAYGLANLIVFVFMVTFFAAIFGIQLFRGQIFDGNIDFANIYNSFLGMYQVLSSENWTDILYSATAATHSWNTAWIAAMFIVIWFMFANLVVLNMFIAVIQESFDISEEDKRLEQIKAFIKKKQLGKRLSKGFSLSHFLGFRHHVGSEPLYRNREELAMLSIIVEQFLITAPPEKEPQAEVQPEQRSRIGAASDSFLQYCRKTLKKEPNPFYHHKRQETIHLRDMVKNMGNEDAMREQEMRQYLKKHPNYNNTLFMFKPTNPVRRFCQRMVAPDRGTQRFDGVEPFEPLRYAFSTFIYASIIVMVVIACVVSPLYQQKYYDRLGDNARPWFVWTDVAFAILFTVEVTIKVIADGFLWTPNAYFRGSWGFIDGLVLITMWINVATSFSKDTSVLRVVGAFRALRALRLLNLSSSARETFHAIVIKGWWKVISAAFVSMSFLIPFAIYGLNLFYGKLQSCNDADFGDEIDSDLLKYCVDEYVDSPFNWDIVLPRVVSNQWYSFDTFPKSLFILFQIVSQEGWIDVMWDTMGMTGQGRQPDDGAQSAYGLFFIAFNLLGSVFVLTLFVSVFMRNYTEETGVAFLTGEQRSWQELRKLLLQVSPSRNIIAKRNKFSEWCYHIASQKHGIWARFMTTVLCFHLVLLIAEFRSAPAAWETAQDILFLILQCFYITNLVIRIVGLTWDRFRKSKWDMYSLVAITGSFITSVMEMSEFEAPGLKPTHKVFLVAVTLLLIPRNNALDQLFKTGAASLPSIASLLATWFVLFLAYAIALTQIFGLTKFGEQEDGSINFRDVPRALILLFRTSCGEGWNEIMEDFAKMTFPYCTIADNFYESDCGSLPWARALFISWNLISMYIFVSLFVSLVFENFSYVYQRSSESTTLSREEIRHFKAAWAKFDPHGTGFIPREDFPRLLKHLSGKFDMRIFSGAFTVGEIVKDCTFVKGEEHDCPLGPMVKSIPKASDNGKEVWIDLGRLNRRVNRMPLREIRKKREKLEEFCEDVMIGSDLKGISFSTCILTIAHYNMIDEWKSMKLDELLRRLVRKQLAIDLMRRRKVLDLINSWILQKRHQDRRNGVQRFSGLGAPAMDIPEIFIEDREYSEPSTPTDSPEVGPQTPMLSPPSTSELHSRNRNMLPRIDTSVATAGSPSERSPSFLSRLANLSPAFSPRPRSMDRDDGGALSPHDAGWHSDNESTMSAHDMRSMIASLDASAWGESMRRSFASRSASPVSPNSPLSPRSPR